MVSGSYGGLTSISWIAQGAESYYWTTRQSSIARSQAMADDLREKITEDIRELKKLGISDMFIRDLLNSYLRLYVAHVLEEAEKDWSKR